MLKGLSMHNAYLFSKCMCLKIHKNDRKNADFTGSQKERELVQRHQQVSAPQSVSTESTIHSEGISGRRQLSCCAAVKRGRFSVDRAHSKHRSRKAGPTHTP